MIREVVQQALSLGYLTLENEDKLRQLLQIKYDSEDLNAFFRYSKRLWKVVLSNSLVNLHRTKPSRRFSVKRLIIVRLLI